MANRLVLPQRPAQVAVTAEGSSDEASAEERIASNRGDGAIAVGVLKRSRDAREAFGYGSVAEGLALLQSIEVVTTSVVPHQTNTSWEAVRIYVNPQLGAACDASAIVSLRHVMDKVDPTRAAWNGSFGDTPTPADHGPESLFFVFNTLESPKVNDRVLRHLSTSDDESGGDGDNTSNDGDWAGSLRTKLHPYQRRSAASMLQKECDETPTLDPRYEEIQGPEDSNYYYNRVTVHVAAEKPLCRPVKGGILAEPMGYGKTLICLSLILATRGQLPCVLKHPNVRCQREHRPGPEGGTGSLLATAAAACVRHCLPWQRVLHNATTCLKACQKSSVTFVSYGPPGAAAASPERSRGRRKPVQLTPSAATLVIVPANLVAHWVDEIKKHVVGAALQVLVMDSQAELPAVDVLAAYDVVLFSKSRFASEVTALGSYNLARRRQSASKPGADDLEENSNPLRRIFWLRVIVDEGHDFSNRSRSLQIFRSLYVERRWIVSGTPAKGLYGVEVSLTREMQEYGNDSGHAMWARRLSTMLTNGDGDSNGSGYDNDNDSTNGSGNAIAALHDAAPSEHMRTVLTEFLCAEPWTSMTSHRSSRWAEYLNSPTVLRRVLQSLIIRHRPEDLATQVNLPPLSSKVVALEPTWYDAVTANLFVNNLLINAITSERCGPDYMFSPANRPHLQRTINNLRQAGFWWTGIKESDVLTMINNAQSYLVEHIESVTPEDASLLLQARDCARQALNSLAWLVCTEYEQLGVIVTNFPDSCREAWCLACDESTEEVMLGIKHAVEARRFVEKHGGGNEAFDGLAGEGHRQRLQVAAGAHLPDLAAPARSSGRTPRSATSTPTRRISRSSTSTPTSRRTPARRVALHASFERTSLVGTTSAKLTYLLDRVLALQASEKIIVFYEHQHFGVWISGALELAGVKHRLYGSPLDARRRKENLVQFVQDDELRVLVMDLKQASHGLHVACASRIFIMSPIWDPNIEGQAIKRAHRMSQTRPVFVETLVLRGTIEEKMLARRKQMQASREGMGHAEKDLLADKTMADIIQAERFINADSRDKTAVLAQPVKLFTAPPSVPPTTVTSAHALGVIDTPPRSPTAQEDPTATTPGTTRGNPILLSPGSCSPRKRLPSQPPLFALTDVDRKKRRVAFAERSDDPFIDSPQPETDGLANATSN
ncbi:hypothetical protein KEM52_002868 [Ascosphaera acerosa]|nr:hypothetical protein KEM52_002868 [Ascosphaera acerosa]